MTRLPDPPPPPPLPTEVIAAYAMRDFVYVDIETIPDQRPDTLAKLREQVTAPSKYSKPESIEAWLAENRESAAIEALAKTSLDGGAGHVCTISWAKNDGDVQVAHATDVGEEKEILQSFFDALDPYRSETLVGHNVAAFDVPFLLKRAVVLGVRIPAGIPRDPKPWSDKIFDTMTAWAGARNFISMNQLCGILGIVGKEDFDGSQVADAWRDGEHMKIAAYCDSDVRRTRLLHQRFLVAGF